jgi:hypothetical protein
VKSQPVTSADQKSQTNCFGPSRINRPEYDMAQKRKEPDPADRDRKDQKADAVE